MKIAITGSSGLIGSALVTAIMRRGDTAIKLVRRPAIGADEIAWEPATGRIDASSLAEVEAVVHLAGAGIGDKRWTKSRKEELVESRVLSTTLLAQTLASLPNAPRVFVSASAIGFYGDRGDEWLTEDSSRGSGFLANLVNDWEAGTSAASSAGIRTVVARTGIVLARTGGALGKQLPLFRLGLGGKIGDGSNWQSWISLQDQVRSLLAAIDGRLSGPVNMVSPNPVTNADFAKTLGQIIGRPAALRVPKLAPAALFGREFVEQVACASQRVQPTRLENSGFEFDHPDLASALRQILTAR